MSIKLNKELYIKLIEEDKMFLHTNCPWSIEFDHIISVLDDSIEMYYPEPDKIKLTDTLNK